MIVGDNVISINKQIVNNRFTDYTSIYTSTIVDTFDQIVVLAEVGIRNVGKKDSSLMFRVSLHDAFNVTKENHLL